MNTYEKVCPIHWERAIALVDMNCFFAAVEARDFPELRGRAIAVTNGTQGTCIITSSYEARAYGIKTGMRLKEARQLYPDLIQRPSRPHVYAEAKGKIMNAMHEVCPDMEIFSFDEAIIDMITGKTPYGQPGRLCRLFNNPVFASFGLLLSVGSMAHPLCAHCDANLTYLLRFSF